MTTTYTFECSNTISEPEAELAFNLGLQLITEYRSITPSLALEREALERNTTLEREALEQERIKLENYMALEREALIREVSLGSNEIKLTSVAPTTD
jgi:hypothetical protein